MVQAIRPETRQWVLSFRHFGRNVKPGLWHTLWVTQEFSTGKESESPSLKGYATKLLMAAFGNFSLLVYIE
jgi:hypothetical protein